MSRKKKSRREEEAAPWPRYVALGSLAILIAVAGSFVLRGPRDEPSPQEPARGFSDRPNVLLISVDTLRADYLGSYGGTEAPTPAIDRLASEGVLFENAVSHVALTLPSHASLFTSRIPPDHGVRDNATYRLAPEQTSVAEVMKSSGYRTAAFIGAFVLDARFGLGQGFDVYDDDLGTSDEPERRADAVLASASEWLEGLRTDEPWFAFVHLFDPHAPYEAGAPYGAEHRQNPYAGEVASVDHAIGVFLDRLRGRNQLDETLVVLTSDHGEGLGEHGERTHGMFAYNSTLHVPFVLRWPGRLPAGLRVRGRVRLIDVAPTVLSLTGLAAPESFEGRSVLPMIEGQNAEEDRTSYFEALTYSFNRGSAPLFGLYDGDYKFVSLPIPELYDVKSDPAEIHNLAPTRASRMREMTNALGVLVTSGESESSLAPSSEVDADALERMRALGYIVAPRRLAGLSREYGPDDDPKRWVHLANELDDAVNAHRTGRLEEANRLLREVLAERPTVSAAYARLARVLDDQGRPDEAMALLEDAFARGLHGPQIVQLLGQHLATANRPERWAEVLETVVRSDPSDADAREALASVLGRLGRHEDALRVLESLAELRPGDAATELELGLANLRAGRLREAEERIRRALELDPATVPAWSALGDVLAARGRGGEAIEAWRRAADSEGTPPEILVRLGLALADAGRGEEALVYLRRFVSSAPVDTYENELAQVRAFITVLEQEPAPTR